MTTATPAPPRVEQQYNPQTRRIVWIRPCDRCGVTRQVRDPRAKRNLCHDCVIVLTPAEVLRWTA